MAAEALGSDDKALAELTIGKHQTANNVAKTAAFESFSCRLLPL